MSGPEEFDFDAFRRGFDADVSGSAEDAAAYLEYTHQSSQAEKQLLRELDRSVFADDVRVSLDLMDEYLACHPDSCLDEMYVRCLDLADNYWARLHTEPKSVEARALVIMADRMAERVSFIARVSGQRSYVATDTKRLLQADILSVKILPLDERKQWAGAVHKLFDGKSINLKDDKEIAEVIAMTEAADEIERQEDMARAFIREALFATIEAVCEQYRIPPHDDLEAVWYRIASTVARGSKDSDHLTQSRLSSIRNETVTMRWPDDAFDSVVDKMWAIKRKIKNADSD